MGTQTQSVYRTRETRGKTSAFNSIAFMACRQRKRTFSKTRVRNCLILAFDIKKWRLADWDFAEQFCPQSSICFKDSTSQFLRTASLALGRHIRCVEAKRCRREALSRDC